MGDLLSYQRLGSDIANCFSHTLQGQPSGVNEVRPHFSLFMALLLAAYPFPTSFPKSEMTAKLPVCSEAPGCFQFPGAAWWRWLSIQQQQVLGGLYKPSGIDASSTEENGVLYRLTWIEDAV